MSEVSLLSAGCYKNAVIREAGDADATLDCGWSRRCRLACAAGERVVASMIMMMVLLLPPPLYVQAAGITFMLAAQAGPGPSNND
jgi:hypothetical protein